jgi:tetratricopeptide (TPR) repeat protein
MGDVDPALLIDLLRSYRAVNAHQCMVDLGEQMPPEVAGTILVQEQYGFALNRLKRSADAERVLQALITQHGPSSETNGLLGRVYKDQWEVACDQGRVAQAEGFRKKALEAYLRGFEADWRDAYPGINALTLMALGPQPDPRLPEVLPVVRYAVTRRLSSSTPDYWDHATLLELAVLAEDQQAAQMALADALAHQREPWEAETTARNLTLLHNAHTARGESAPWLADIVTSLKAACS